VAETYQEVERVVPRDDRITIIGIPISQITSTTRAALAGLVAENATLRAQVRRLELQLASIAAPPVLGRDAFIARLGELTATTEPGSVWALFLIHVQTYDDIRRSSGLLAANSVLADVGQRLRQVNVSASPPDGAPLPVAMVGSVGGLSLGALISVPAGTDPETLAAQVHEQLTSEGYDVAGLAMALAMTVTGIVVGAAESPLLTMGRVDHISRAPRGVGA
jgi:hypothetical protein